jgi:cytochrome c-type biogenesis protein CcmE
MAGELRSDHDDTDSTPDAGALPPLDLSPRTVPPHDASTTRRGANRGGLIAIAVLVALTIAGVFVVRALGSSTLYFYNADEAVAQKVDLEGKRFRMQGTVVPDTVKRSGEGVGFDVRYAEAVVPVHHVGDPPQLFQPGIPVVLEGQWDEYGSLFRSDRILVKHTEEYQEKNSDRLRQAEENSSNPPAGAPDP